MSRAPLFDTAAINTAAITAKIKQLIQKSWSQLTACFIPERLLPWCVSLVVILGITLSFSLVGADAAHATNFDRKNLRQQSFAGQDLTDNDYTRADMTDADLSNTNLRGVRLFTTHLDRANLEGADMTGATLDGATLIKANLKNAVLEGAYVISADFRGADIEGADFTDVLFDPRVNNLLCETADGTNPVTGRDTRETLYCE